MNANLIIGKLYSLLLLLLMVGCAGPGSQTKYQPSSSKLVLNQNDDEHELIIIDSGFDRWFQLNGRQPNYYSLSYYETQNRRYVTAWNNRVRQIGSIDSPFQTAIDYNFNENYGLDLNYKLFWYFRYIEDQYGRQYGFPF